MCALGSRDRWLGTFTCTVSSHQSQMALHLLWSGPVFLSHRWPAMVVFIFLFPHHSKFIPTTGPLHLRFLCLGTLSSPFCPSASATNLEHASPELIAFPSTPTPGSSAVPHGRTLQDSLEPLLSGLSALPGISQPTHSSSLVHAHMGSHLGHPGSLHPYLPAFRPRCRKNALFLRCKFGHFFLH